MKVNSTLASFGLAVALMFSTAVAAPKKAADDTKAAEKPAAEKTAPKAKKDTYPLYGPVVAVTPKLLTIKGGEGKEDRKFDITADTKIVNGEKDATIADIKVGAKVGGLVKKSAGSGNDTALKINVGVAQEAKKKAPEKTADAPKKKKSEK